MTTSLSAPSLAEPLARALLPKNVQHWFEDMEAAVAILAKLRRDPATLIAVAEALHEADRLEHPGARGSIAVEWRYLNEQEQAHELYRAARLANILLGWPPELSTTPRYALGSVPGADQ